MEDKEKQYISMKEMLTKRSFETITNCNCRKDKDGAFVDLLNQELEELQKEKQIEVNKIIELIRPLNIVCDNNDCEKCPCSVENRLCTEERVARVIIEHYQPKLPKDSVVLSREEYAELKHTKILLKELEKDKKFYQNAVLNNLKEIEKLENQLEQTRKETAEKIYNDIFALINNAKDKSSKIFGNSSDYGKGYKNSVNHFNEHILELSKRYNVEIKE